MRPARVAIVTLGCGRNEADSDHVAGALEAAGLDLVSEPADADCVLVNTCTFIGPARQESVETIVAACDLRGPAGEGPAVLVIGCMAERHREELAVALPEVAGVHGFADYPNLPALVRAAVGAPAAAGAVPAGARLPVVAVPNGQGRVSAAVPNGEGRAPAAGPPSRQRRAPDAPPTAAFPPRTTPRGPWAYLKIAGGCDRKCTFCTIPSYRGRFASRPAAEVVAEARWLADRGVREVVCVSENTTSYGKDTPQGRGAQIDLIRGLETVEGLERVRFAYLQPDELTDALLDAMAWSPVVAGYYDLSLQHASSSVLARMARSGGAERFLALIEGVRARDPGAVFRSSFIVGFPGETEADVETLEAFLEAAGIDWPGFFAYSREDGTPSAALPGQVDADETRARLERLASVAELVADERARAFVGRELRVLVESRAGGGAVGRSYREGPETDGEVRLPGVTARPGDVVRARVVAAEGVDLVAEAVAGTARRDQARSGGGGRAR